MSSLDEGLTTLSQWGIILEPPLDSIHVDKPPNMETNWQVVSYIKFSNKKKTLTVAPEQQQPDTLWISLGYGQI